MSEHSEEKAELEARPLPFESPFCDDDYTRDEDEPRPTTPSQKRQEEEDDDDDDSEQPQQPPPPTRGVPRRASFVSFAEQVEIEMDDGKGGRVRRRSSLASWGDFDLDVDLEGGHSAGGGDGDVDDASSSPPETQSAEPQPPSRPPLRRSSWLRREDSSRSRGAGSSSSCGDQHSKPRPQLRRSSWIRRDDSSRGSVASGIGGGGGGRRPSLLAQASFVTMSGSVEDGAGSFRTRRRRSSFTAALRAESPQPPRRRLSNCAASDGAAAVATPSGSGHGKSAVDDKLEANVLQNAVARDDPKIRAVFCLRALTMLALVAAAVACSVLTHHFVSSDEREDFETRHRDSVVKVAEAFRQGLQAKTLAASALAAVYISRFGYRDDGTGAAAARAAAPWPNATLPHFVEQASGQLLLSRGRAISFNPVVRDESRLSWESYASRSKSAALGVSADPSRLAHVDGGIFGKNPPAESSRFPNVSVPVWQIAPVEGNERAVLFNLHSERDRIRALDDVIENGVPALTAILQLVQDEETRPSSILFYPVFDRFSDDIDGVVTEDEGSGSGPAVVGTISIVFSWDEVLAYVLPDSVKGVVAVLESSTGQQFTYRISGNKAELVGEGDLHDPRYDDMRFEAHADLEGTVTMAEDNKGVAEDEEEGNGSSSDYLITYSLCIYPSAEMEAQYVTDRATIFTAAVVLIFVCTSALFLLYDYLVEHRQNRLMRAAIRTGRIVDSMFPALVRDRLFRDAETGMAPPHLSAERRASIRRMSRRRSSASNNSIIVPVRPKGKGLLPRTLKRPKSIRHLVSSYGTESGTIIKQFINRGHAKEMENPDFDVSSAREKDCGGPPPIADLFPHTSIMFCDIVGFTAWSAKRSPDDVFLLLESLFWEFDALAARRGVFKLGTIGDCYIAVTGLPDPRDDHALVLATFAEECRRTMNAVCESLSYELGYETMELSVRLGIHSGAVTGGVLRGHKSRFELFGDTINTASRMESTGAPDRVQVSSDTAELLIDAGREKWLKPREDAVWAKGKGEMKTYWVQAQLDGDESPPSSSTEDDGMPSIDDPIDDDATPPSSHNRFSNANSSSGEVEDSKKEILAACSMPDIESGGIEDEVCGIVIDIESKDESHKQVKIGQLDYIYPKQGEGSKSNSLGIDVKVPQQDDQEEDEISLSDLQKKEYRREQMRQWKRNFQSDYTLPSTENSSFPHDTSKRDLHNSASSLTSKAA